MNERKNTKRNNLNVKLHEELKKKYHFCFYCGKYIVEYRRTIDHVIPLSKDGADTEDNLVVACKRCNKNKSDLSLEEFIQLSLDGYFEPETVLKRQQAKIHAPEVKKIQDNVEFEEKIVRLKDVSISTFLTPPKTDSIKKRLNHYMKTGEFQKTAIAEEIITNKGRTLYRLKQGYINYLILKDLDVKTMKIKVYKTKKNNKKITKKRD